MIIPSLRAWSDPIMDMSGFDSIGDFPESSLQRPEEQPAPLQPTCLPSVDDGPDEEIDDFELGFDSDDYLFSWPANR